MNILIGVVSMVSWIVIEIMTILNPSGTIPVQVPMEQVMPLYLVAAAAAFTLPYVASVRKRHFFRCFFVCFALLMTISWSTGALIHRDFFAFTTPVVLIFVTVFLYRIADLNIVKKKAEVLPRLANATVITFILWIGWIMMMSYAIVTRTEPRWIESIAYNLTNGVLGVVMLYVGLTLYERAKRTIHFHDQRWYLDDRDVSALLSPQEGRIVQLLFSRPDQPITCRRLIDELYQQNGHPRGPFGECEKCLTEEWTASQCPTYRNMKNRIADTKKYLELLQIGTIVPASENPRDIKELGWRLRLFDDVRISSLR